MERNPLNRSFRYGIARQDSSERCSSKDYGYRAIVLKYNRPSGIRNVSAKIISRIKKVNSFINISGSKENLNPKFGPPRISSERTFDKSSEKPESLVLQPAPNIFPVIVSRFSLDLERLEEKLSDYYSQ